MAEPQTNRALVARRAYLDISQRALAFKTDLTENRVWRIENGVTEPTDAEREAIATALDCTVAELFPQPSEASTSEVAR